MMTNKPAPFITFEGGEGAGKSTQLKLLKTWLESLGKTVLATREPGGTPGGEAIRELIVQGGENRWDAKTDTLLFMASRRDLLTKAIWPALEQGQWVICDRFMDSTYAYQCFGRGLDLGEIKALYHFVAGDFLPSLTFLFDIDPQFGLDRVLAGKDRNTAENRYESFDLSFHQRLRDGYHTLASAEPDRFVILDAVQDIETIQKRIHAELLQRFRL